MNTKRKQIALVAHDNRKNDLREWAGWNYRVLLRHNIVCTGTTGTMVEEIILEKVRSAQEYLKSPEQPLNENSLIMTKLKSGPLGGDQQLGAMIAEGKIDFIIFFWDPMEPHPHDVDVKALLRIAVVYNIPIACNRATADFLISSPLMNNDYCPSLTDFSAYVNRKLPQSPGGTG